MAKYYFKDLSDDSLIRMTVKLLPTIHEEGFDAKLNMGEKSLALLPQDTNRVDQRGENPKKLLWELRLKKLWRALRYNLYWIVEFCLIPLFVWGLERSWLGALVGIGIDLYVLIGLKADRGVRKHKHN